MTGLVVSQWRHNPLGTHEPRRRRAGFCRRWGIIAPAAYAAPIEGRQSQSGFVATTPEAH